jgi:hypothetical protein
MCPTRLLGTSEQQNKRINRNETFKIARPGRNHLRCPFLLVETIAENRSRTVGCISGCLAGDGRFEKKKKDSYHQKVNKTTDSDAFQYIPIDHIDERLIYLWGAGFGRGVVMMA